MPSYNSMLSPYTIKNLRFKNRILASPVTTNRVALNGAPTAECIDTYETRARGGFAQVTVSESFVDFDFAARHSHGMDLVSKNLSVLHIESIETLTEAIKSHGAIASIQLNHVGGTNHPSSCSGKNPIGPSSFKRPDGVQVDEMDEDMLENAAESFANACAMAKAFGFDMVMLHGGHGWLLSQFLSPLSNKRTDKWGGSLENRARFPLFVLDKIRAKVGNFPIEYRISGDERVPGGMGIDETVEFCRMLENKVDLIHVTSGIYHSHVETKAFSSMFEPHGCNLDLAYAVKKGTSIPVVSVGGFNSPDQAEAAISEGKCDFVALGRQQFADPEFVNKARAGLEGEIAPCLRCSCFNPLPPDPDSRALPQLWHCSVNPTAGRELRWRTAPTPQISRKVLIAGGGPSGLYAAATAAARGHKVILCEKSDKLGGVLWFADHDPHKESLMRYRDSLIRRCERLGVEIRVGVPVTAALVISINPDKTICACGAEPATPRIPGIEHARYALSAYSNPDLIGTRVLMIGGGLVGCETALHLAQKGHQVHLVELRNDIALDANDSHRRALIPLMSKCMTWECGVSVSRIESLDSPDALNPYLVFYSNSKSQDSQNFDTVLYATGLKPLTDLALELQAENIDFVSIGDCSSPRQVKQAVYEGFCAAMDIL